MNHPIPGDLIANPLAFLMGGGEMGRLIRSMDWAKTVLGPVATWSQSLRTTVSICLASDLPICIIWGPGLVQLYNDAYRVICGSKHPRSMGQNFAECWNEAWPVIGAAHDSALAGNTAFLESQQIFLERHGYIEECFFTFSFSPIRDEDGRVGGLFHPVIEMTAQTLSERRTRMLRDIAANASKGKSVSEVLSLTARTLDQFDLDLPFVRLYTIEPDAGRLVRVTGRDDLPNVSTGSFDANADESLLWPVEDVCRSGLALTMDDLAQRIDVAALGPYSEPPTQALVLPIIPPGMSSPVAIVVAGVSSRLKLDEPYRSFYDALASAVNAGIANARAYDEERRRAQALADLDRAKILFFSSVSHEFRTPLTLILGPLEDALGAPGSHPPRLEPEQLDMVYRNGLRLQRLVNSLLEFSKVEAGRAGAAFQATALAELTADLASNFRSACEKAGLELRVDCPSFPELVFVDRAMWETVVLNLLSNAFKFTFEGSITVAFRQTEGAAELRVSDTGTGVPPEEIPLLFERFHRVENARGRTHEGSGIGLALVHELVRLHGGTVTIESKWGQGTTFAISIPLGLQHLPKDQIANGPATAQRTTTPNAFAQEALRWLPGSQDSAPSSLQPLALQDGSRDNAAAPPQDDGERPVVLIADDNTDMRHYLVRMLAPHYRTEAVADGEAALSAALARVPDLILTDVMMPRLDGFGLLQALRADARTAGVPVIMLSARAGEESRLEGLQEGVDDYLVKPFSGRELLARVAAHLQMARMRRDSIEAIRAGEAQFRALVSASSDAVYRMNADWTEMRHLQGREFIVDTDEPNRSWLEKYIHPDDQQRVIDAIRHAIHTKGNFELEHQVVRVDGTLGWTFSRATPLLDKNGNIAEWLGMASDVTARRQVQEALAKSEQKYRTLFASMDEGYCVIDMLFDEAGRPVDFRYVEINPAFEKHTGLRNAQGRRMQDLAHDHDGHWCATFARVAATGEPVSFIHHAPMLDGRWLDMYAFRLDGQDTPRVAVLFNDISAHKRDEEERERLVARLREEDQRKDEFLATLAHELRNPLAPIRSGLQIMRMAQGDAAATERVRAMMERQVTQMVHLIDDLLDLSRISHGKIDLRIERIELAAAIQQAIEASRPAIAQADHALLTKFPPGPIYVDADLTRIAQVFSNLLNNAAKFTDRGGQIQVTMQALDGHAVVSVKDSGIGIPSQMLSHVFDMFKQIDSSMGRSKEGLGIGLFIVKRLVEMHGGSIEVLCDGPGNGSEFVVRLPMAAAPAVPEPASLPGPQAGAPHHHILVVDDNADAAETLSMLLTFMGNRTQTAYDGASGLELAAQFTPQVIFLDIGMPTLNGYDVARHIRLQAWGRDMVLVALTGWGQDEDKRLASEAGFNFHLTKPVLPADLETLLSDITVRKTAGLPLDAILP
jgi:signal transduction histidine kinase/DNA-binding response OmpR family regulator